MNLNISRSLKTVQSVVTANSPVLLVGASIAGIVATGVLSAKAGYKARGIVDEAQAKRDLQNESAPLTVQEKASLTWLCYVAPAITGVTAITSCLGVHVIHTKRHAALAGLYAITANKLDDYKDEAEKLLGTKKSQQLNDTMGQKGADAHPLVDNQLIVTEGGTELCFDDWSGRWFMSNMNLIAAGVNEANSILIDEGDLDLNTLYDRLGLPPIPQGTEMGWSGTPINIIYGAILNKEGKSAISITFRDSPQVNMGRRR